LKVIRSFKYRCYPTKSKELKLNQILENSRLMYNKILEVEKNLLNDGQPAILKYDLAMWCDKNKNIFPYWKDIPSFAKLYIATRVSDSLIKCFKKQSKFPRFKSLNSYNSIIFPKSGVSNTFYSYEEKSIKIPIIGKIKTIFHRLLPKDGKIFTITIKKNKSNQWFVCISIEFEIQESLQHQGPEVGIDVGITKLVTLSNGEEILNPRFYEKKLDRLKVLSKQFSRKKKGSKNQEKQRVKLAKVYNKITNQRHDFLQRLSFNLTKEYSLISLEDLDLKRMVEGKGYKNPYSKGILDSGWGILKYNLQYKSKITGTKIIYVNPKNTTQMCSNCGNIPYEKIQIWNRTYLCEKCGLELDRDLNAAINILKLSGRNHPVASLEL